MTQKKKPATRVTVAVVVWEDSALHGLDQRSREDLKAKGLVGGISAGVIVHEDPQQIMLAGDYFPVEDQFRQASSYPKRMISQIRRFSMSAPTWCRKSEKRRK